MDREQREGRKPFVGRTIRVGEKECRGCDARCHDPALFHYQLDNGDRDTEHRFGTETSRLDEIASKD